MMTKEEAAEKAVEYKHSGNNCTQSVVMALADLYGLNSEELKMATAGFAGGMGTMETTCGALIGSNLIAGLKTKGVKTIMISRELYHSFNKACGATICKDLKGISTGKVICECDDCVRNAVISAASLL